MATTAGLAPEFKRRVEAWLAAGGGKFYILSGYRSTARQKVLFAEAVKKYGSAEKADNYVARPGTSNHERGEAVDIAPKSQYEYAARLAPQFGLGRPMQWEAWHFERKGNPSTNPSPPQGADEMSLQAIWDKVNFISEMRLPDFLHQILDSQKRIMDKLNFLSDDRTPELYNKIMARLDAIDEKLK